MHRFLPTPLVQVPAAAPTKAHGDTKDEIDGYEVIPNALASLADSPLRRLSRSHLGHASEYG